MSHAPFLGLGTELGLQTRQTAAFFDLNGLSSIFQPEFQCKILVLFLREKEICQDMDQSQDVNLEELFWRSPQHVQMMGGYLHSNNILFYFAESPFFDATSNNASLAIQANYNEAFRRFLETREVFEGRLKTMQGLEFMVTYDPLQGAAQSETEFAHTPSNIWVIRKQLRQKRPEKEDDIVVLSTYYVVGDAVYMAPAVSSVVGNRILSAVTSLTKLLNVASPLPIFTPSYGHAYMPPGPKAVDAPQTASQSTQQSKELTPVPDSQGSAKTSLTTATSTSTTGNTKDTSYQDTRTLMEAMNLLSRYGDEFMDETPLSGEPGSFILSKASENTTGSRRVTKTTTTTTTSMQAPAVPRKIGTPSMTEPSTPAKGSE